MSVTIKLELPDNVIREAEANGLLQSGVMGNLLVTELERRKGTAPGRSAPSLGTDGSPSADGLRSEFEDRAERWARETAVYSSPTKRFMHEDYQTIMSMGQAAIPLILQRLERTPDDWFWALKHLAREDAARGAENFSGAVAAWLKWGKERGFISE